MASTDLIVISTDSKIKKRVDHLGETLKCAALLVADEADVIEDPILIKTRFLIIHITKDLLKEEAFGKIQVCRQIFKNAFIVVVLVNPLVEADLLFCKKSGANIILFEEQFTKTPQIEFIASYAVKNSHISISEHQLAIDQPVDFSIFYYMPTNDKIIKLFKKDTVLGGQEFKKITNNHKLFIDRSGLEDFESYSEKNKATLTQSTEITKLKQNFSFLNSKFFDLLFYAFDISAPLEKDRAAALIKLCIEYAKSLISKINSVNDLVHLLDHDTFYPDNIFHRASFIALFSLWLAKKTQVESIDDVIITALVNDLGLVELEPDYLKRIMTIGLYKIKRENNPYYGHPQKTISILSKMSFPLSQNCRDSILAIHERADGKGFPRELKPEHIPITSMIVNFFQLLDKRILEQKATEVINVKKIMLEIIKNEEENPGQFTVEFLRKIKLIIEKAK